MHRQLGAASTIGIDSSPAMLAGTAALVAPGLTFQQLDITAFVDDPSRAGGFDLVFSNAAIHWLADHRSLLRRIALLLKPGGQLAIQIPANDDDATHETARTVARRAPFADVLAGWVRPVAVLRPEQYATVLHALGFAEQHVRLVVYPHVLESRDATVEWVRGSFRTDYQKRLPAEAWEQFVHEYRNELFRALPDAKPFFFPFKRILFWASK
jgi:trans-aconitate 2-methyltransferase